MDSFTRMLNAQLILLLYMAVGIFCIKKQLIDQHTKKKLIDIILKITLPCMIFESFNQDLTPEILKQVLAIFLVALFLSILAYFLGKILYNRYPPEKKSILQYCTLVNNSGFLGMPMVSAVYGAEGLFAASIFIIPARIFMWTAGLAVFTVSDFRTKCKNIFLNPCIIAVFLGLFRRMTGLWIPGFLDTGINNIGAITSPLSMMVIGTMMVGVPWKKLLEPSIFYLSFVRLIALPAIALIILHLIYMDSTLIGVAAIITGMPAGSTSALLASKYGADEDYASRCIITTTILSLVTVPLLILFI